jgi:hypothetical protein
MAIPDEELTDALRALLRLPGGFYVGFADMLEIGQLENLQYRVESRDNAGRVLWTKSVEPRGSYGRRCTNPRRSGPAHRSFPEPLGFAPRAGTLSSIAGLFKREESMSWDILIFNNSARAAIARPDGARP